jgi:uncharacterized protein
MRTLSRLTVLLLGIAGLGSVAWGQCNTNCCNQTCPERRTISVNGSAEITADADLAVVRVGYKLNGPDAKSVYASALQTSNPVMQALTGSGIPTSVIESTSQVLQHTAPYEMQQLSPRSEDRTQREFNATQSWTIRVKPDDAAGALNAAINAGANESGWIQWIVNDPSTLQAEASAKAYANARLAAEQIAEKSGVHLGKLVSVNENQGPVGYGNGFGFGSAGGAIYGMGDAVMMAGAIPGQNQQLAINSRRVEFRATVYAVFAIEDGATLSK